MVAPYLIPILQLVGKVLRGELQAAGVLGGLNSGTSCALTDVGGKSPTNKINNGNR